MRRADARLRLAGGGGHGADGLVRLRGRFRHGGQRRRSRPASASRGRSASARPAAARSARTRPPARRLALSMPSRARPSAPFASDALRLRLVGGRHDARKRRRAAPPTACAVVGDLGDRAATSMRPARRANRPIAWSMASAATSLTVDTNAELMVSSRVVAPVSVIFGATGPVFSLTWYSISGCTKSPVVRDSRRSVKSWRDDERRVAFARLQLGHGGLVVGERPVELVVIVQLVHDHVAHVRARRSNRSTRPRPG